MRRASAVCRAASDSKHGANSKAADAMGSYQWRFIVCQSLDPTLTNFNTDDEKGMERQSEREKERSSDS